MTKFDKSAQEQAVKQYAELMRLIEVGAYDERELDGSYGEDGVERTIDTLEHRARLNGLKFVWDDQAKSSMLVPMAEQEKAGYRQFVIDDVKAHVPAHANVWHKERKLKDVTEYYVSIVDGERTINVIMKVNMAQKQALTDWFVPADYDYTVHDACEHDVDYCVLDDPHSPEYHDMDLRERHFYAVKTMREKQQKEIEQIIEDRLRPY